MKYFFIITLLACANCQAQQTSEKNQEKPHYQFKTPSFDGIGKVYMGREISQVMGHQGADWLEREEREVEENPSKALKALEKLMNNPQAVIADIGAGSGYYAFRLAKIFKNGKIYAVDIQKEMLQLMQDKLKKEKIGNLETVLGSETSPLLPKDTLDLALLVDVYHEFAFPHEMMLQLKESMKKGGKVVLLEYKAEDDEVPIKPLHKTSERQIRKELEAIGFRFVENRKILPWQHFLVFEK